MIIGVLKEPASEARVSLSPETVAALVKKGCDILVEMNAGANAFVVMQILLLQVQKLRTGPLLLQVRK